MITPIAPGPATNGSAMGENDTSAFAAACSFSASVLVSRGTIMPKPECATTRPPAICSEAIVMPKALSTRLPRSAKTPRMVAT